MQKRKMSGRVPRSLGSDRHRTEGVVGGGEDPPYAAQPATAKTSRRRSAAGRFMAIF
jgi:hypothetical protein